MYLNGNFLTVFTCLVVCCCASAHGSSAQYLTRAASTYVAFERLSPQDRNKVDHIFAHHPCYSVWEAAVVPTVSGTDELAILLLSATGDIQNPRGTGMGDSQPCEQRAVALLQMDSTSKLMQTQFHMPTSTAPAMEKEIILLQNLLKSKASETLKACALVRLIRLIADIHQRLVCTYGDLAVMKIEPLFEPDASWKDWIDRYGGPTEASVLLATASLDIEAPPEKEDLEVADWVEEGCGETSSRAATEDQISHSTERRVALSGYRLAAVLHEDLAMA
jgi:hypothetical protein